MYCGFLRNKSIKRVDQKGNIVHLVTHMSYYLRYLISTQSNVEEINLFSWHQRLYRSNGIDRLVKVVAAGRGGKHEVGHLVWRERMEGVAGRHEGASCLVTRLKRDAFARILQRQFLRDMCRHSY